MARSATEERLVFLLLLLIMLSSASSVLGVNMPSLTLRVYEDGVVHVEEKIFPDKSMGNVTVNLLTNDVENLIVLREDGTLLNYDLTADKLVIHYDSLQEVIIYYDTDALTFKNGSLWILELYLPMEAAILLPSKSMILSLTDIPRTITSEGGLLKLILSPGYWRIEYIMRVGETSFNENAQQNFPVLILVGSLGGFVAALSTIIFVRRFRRGLYDLSEDEKRILEIIRKRRRVSESDIRALTHLPKTTVWRVVRRLERRGLVRVVKVNRRNEVELA